VEFITRTCVFLFMIYSGSWRNCCYCCF